MKINKPTTTTANLISFQNLNINFNYVSTANYSFSILIGVTNLATYSITTGGKLGVWVHLSATVINITNSYLSTINFTVDRMVQTISNPKNPLLNPSNLSQVFLRQDVSSTSTTYAYFRLWKTPISVPLIFQNIGKYFFDAATNFLLSYYDFRINRQNAMNTNFYDSLKEMTSWTTQSIASTSPVYDIDDSISVQCGKTTMLDLSKQFPECIKIRTLKTLNDGSAITFWNPPGTIFQKSLTLINSYTFEFWLKFDSLELVATNSFITST